MRFLLVDRILRLVEGKEAVIRKNVSNSEDFFTDHFSTRPIMPGCLILETCDQAARLLLCKTLDFTSLPALEALANGKLQHFVQPGDAVEVRVVIIRLTTEAAEVQASASVEGRTVARATMSYRLEQAAADPEARRACERMREFHRMLTTDVLESVRVYHPRAADSGREVEVA